MSRVPGRPDITPLSSPEMGQDSEPAVWPVVLSPAGPGGEGEASIVSRPVGYALEQRGCEVLLGMVPMAAALPHHRGMLTLAGPLCIKAPCASPIQLC